MTRSRSAKFCHKCGTRRSSEARFCNNCGTPPPEHCKKCGKKLNFFTKTNKSEYLCYNCFKEENPEPVRYFAKYLGGYAAYPTPKFVEMLTYLDRLEVPALRLTIPYDLLENIQTFVEETLVITFIDVIGIEQNPVFEVSRHKISEIQPFLYQQMKNARLGN